MRGRRRKGRSKTVKGGGWEGGGGGGREKRTDRHTETETERQSEKKRKTDRDRDSDGEGVGADRRTERERERERQRQRQRHRERETDRQTDRQKGEDWGRRKHTALRRSAFTLFVSAMRPAVIDQRLSVYSLRLRVAFLSCPLVKKHADLSGSFLYSQLTMKDMYSKPAN